MDEIKNLTFGASIEKLSNQAYLARSHDDGGVYGDSWKWCAVIEIDGNRAYVKGLKTDNFSKEDFEKLAEISRALGATEAVYDRIKSGKTIRKRVIL